jgi:hypothetical protein
LNGLVETPSVDQDEPTYLLVRLGEGAVGNGHFAAPQPDSGHCVNRLKRLGGYEVSALPEHIVVGQALVNQRVGLLLG